MKLKRALLAVAFTAAFVTAAHAVEPIQPYNCNGSLTFATGKTTVKVQNLQAVWSRADKAIRFDIPPTLGSYFEGIKSYVVNVEHAERPTVTLTGHEPAERPGDEALDCSGTFNQRSGGLELEVWTIGHISELWMLACRAKRVVR
jgi:hypothetical protein